jgi:hypothetical protein
VQLPRFKFDSRDKNTLAEKTLERRVAGACSRRQMQNRIENYGAEITVLVGSKMSPG